MKCNSGAISYGKVANCEQKVSVSFVAALDSFRIILKMLPDLTK
jgi:hypothetical protein